LANGLALVGLRQFSLWLLSIWLLVAVAALVLVPTHLTFVLVVAVVQAVIAPT
jgi:hypothetical protein